MRRHGALLIVGIALTQCGCSALIAMSGKNVENCDTREEIRAKLGNPVTSEAHYDEFHTHWKVAETVRAGELGLLNSMSLGLCEFALFPREIYHAVRNVVRGQDLRVHYDEDGKVIGGSSKRLQLNGYGVATRLNGYKQADGKQRDLGWIIPTETAANQSPQDPGWILPADVAGKQDR